MIGKTFIIENIPNYIIKSAIDEGERIYDSLYTNKESFSGIQRSKREVIIHSLLGKIGEYFLIKEFQYVNDPEKWHDLISPNGERTEVKTWKKTTKHIDIKVQEELRRIKNKKSGNQNWFHSTKLVIIEYDEENNLLEIYGEYDI